MDQNTVEHILNESKDDVTSLKDERKELVTHSNADSDWRILQNIDGLLKQRIWLIMIRIQMVTH